MQYLAVPVSSVGEGVFSLPKDTVHQLQRVLRSRPGDHVVLIDGTGWAYEVALRVLQRDRVTAEVVRIWQPESEPPTEVTLYQAVPKGRRWDWLLQKATELGVARVVPLQTERSVVRGAGNLERWNSIVREAAEQSHRARWPQVTDPVTLDQALDAFPDRPQALIACLDPRARSLGCALSDLTLDAPIALFVGPEGGFSEVEVEAAMAKGLIPVSLGPRVLRAETAPLALLALIMARFEAW